MPPLRDQIEQSLLAFFQDKFGLNLPSAGTELIEAGILDSLMLVDVVLYMEQEFEIATSLEDLDVENFSSVAKMADFVTAQRAAQEPDLGAVRRVLEGVG